MKLRPTNSYMYTHVYIPRTHTYTRIHISREQGKRGRSASSSSAGTNELDCNTLQHTCSVLQSHEGESWHTDPRRYCKHHRLFDVNKWVWVAVRCRALLCVAVCCSNTGRSRCVAEYCHLSRLFEAFREHMKLNVCCSALPCVAVCCSSLQWGLQWVAVWVAVIKDA